VNTQLGIVFVCLAAWIGYAWSEPVPPKPGSPSADKPGWIVGDASKLIRDGQATLDRFNADGATLITHVQPINPAKRTAGNSVCGPQGCYWQSAPAVVTIPESRAEPQAVESCEPRGPLRRLFAHRRR